MNLAASIAPNLSSISGNPVVPTFISTSTMVGELVVSSEFGHFDTKSFRYESTRYKLKSFRDIKVDSIHVESRFGSTQPLRSQLFSGPTGAKIAILVSQ